MAQLLPIESCSIDVLDCGPVFAWNFVLCSGCCPGLRNHWNRSLRKHGFLICSPWNNILSKPTWSFQRNKSGLFRFSCLRPQWSQTIDNDRHPHMCRPLHELLDLGTNDPVVRIHFCRWLGSIDFCDECSLLILEYCIWRLTSHIDTYGPTDRNNGYRCRSNVSKGIILDRHIHKFDYCRVFFY